MIQIGNFGYFLAIAVLIAVTLFANYGANRLGRRFVHILCYTLMWMNFLLHFYKQLSPYYFYEFPYSLRMSTGENLCALTIMLSPFVYSFGPKPLKDYLCIISIISGAAVYLFPTTALGLDLSVGSNLLEVMRFYFCHLPLVLVPVLLISSGEIVISYKNSIWLPFFFMGHMLIVFINDMFLMLSGIVDQTWLDLISRDVRNGALAMGPPSSMDAALSWLYPILPHFYIDGILYFVPAIWATVPLLLFGPLIGLAFAYPRERLRIKRDLRGFRLKRRFRKEEREALRTLKGEIS